MRGLCKEEDYAFLGTSERTTKESDDGAQALEDDWRHKKEERVRDKEKQRWRKRFKTSFEHIKFLSFSNFVHSVVKTDLHNI